jgi:hypothetical protein
MKKIFLKFLLVCSIAFVSYSCSKKIDEAYANPNAAVKVPPEELLPQIVAAMAANYAGHGTMNDIRYAGAYVQNWHYYSTLSNFDRMGYTNTDVAQSIWRMHYYDIGQNNEKMILWAAEQGKWDYVGVGKAISAWSWLTLTDYHGEVILKEAFNTDLITFKYDTQEDVYNHVRKLCFEALENLNKTGDGVNQANLAKGDAFFYNGDVNKWKKFTYGVLARYHNHLSNKSIYNPDSVIYYTNLSINTNADNAAVKFANTANSATKNFFGPFRGNLGGASTVSPTAIRQGKYSADLLTGINSAFPSVEDPRAWYLLRGNANGTIKGVPLNVGQTVLAVNDRPENFHGVSQVVTTNATTPGSPRFIFRDDAPFPIMTASEIQFIKAEAAYRKGNKGLALSAYKEGIRLHFEMLASTYNVNIPAGKEITPAIIDAFLNNTAVVPATSEGLTLSKIMLQKYIAMWGYGILETWVDMRRFHYTDSYQSEAGQVYADFAPPSGGDLFQDNNGELVYRMRPRFNSEYVWNIVELQRIGATTNDYHTLETWFSKPQ